MAGPEPKLFGRPGVGPRRTAQRQGPNAGGDLRGREGLHGQEAGKAAHRLPQHKLTRVRGVRLSPQGLPGRPGREELGRGPALQTFRGLHQGRRLLEGRLADPPERTAAARRNVGGDEGVPSLALERAALAYVGGVVGLHGSRSRLEAEAITSGLDEPSGPRISAEA